MLKQCLILIGFVLVLSLFLDDEEEIIIVDYTTPRPVSIINNEKEQPDLTWRSSITPINEK
jgi:hypothetical protein